MTSRDAQQKASGVAHPRVRYFAGAGLALAVASLATWACGGGTSGTPPTGDAGATTLSAGQALQVLLTANSGEVQIGQVAQSRAVNPLVRTFADQMVSEHSAALRRLNQLAGGTGATDGGTADGGTSGGADGGVVIESVDAGTPGTGGVADAGTGGTAGSGGALMPEPSGQSTALEQQVAQTIASLQTLSGEEFDRTYVDSQITMHASVLQLIDTVVAAAAATNPALQTEVQLERTMVQNHLQSACQLQQTLLKTGSGGLDAGIAVPPVGGGAGTGDAGTGAGTNAACSTTAGPKPDAGIGGTTTMLPGVFRP